MARYAGRSASNGNITLNSSRKGGQTFTYWFYISLGRASCGRDRWVEFDIRDVANKIGVELPQFMTSEEIEHCGKSRDAYEQLLKRDLQRAADWCNQHNVLAVIAQAMGGAQ